MESSEAIFRARRQPPYRVWQNAVFARFPNLKFALAAELQFPGSAGKTVAVGAWSAGASPCSCLRREVPCCRGQLTHSADCPRHRSTRGGVGGLTRFLRLAVSWVNSPHLVTAWR